MSVRGAARQVVSAPYIRPIWRALRDRQVVYSWQRAGCPVPPPHAYKQQVVKQFAARFGAATLVETGTFQGDMVVAVCKYFSQVHTIELGSDLAARASARFRSDPRIHVYNGDSREILKRILPRIEAPVLFWLDAHYSAGITARAEIDSPISEELEFIFASQERPTILIDDARAFDGVNGYLTAAGLRETVESRRPGSIVELEHDIFRIYSR
jgi:hypothetical protein